MLTAVHVTGPDIPGECSVASSGEELIGGADQ